MMPPIRCRAFGRRIATDILLPGAIRDENPHPPEIVIRRLGAAERSDDAGRSVWREGNTLHYAPPDVAAYRCTVPGSIDVAPAPDADESDMAALLIATALPALLWMQGAFMLHASAALLPAQESVVAIAAPSGKGKSTMLTELVARGARAAADDSLCLRPDARAVWASGLPGGYFAYHADPAARPFMWVASRQIVDEAPLGAILLLSRHPSDEPATFRRLAPWEALLAVLSHRHRAAVAALFGDPGQRLRDATRIARVPAYRWSRPDGSVPLTDAEWQAMLGIMGEGGDG
jgi:hypothetical protein